jgi:hypothetical protein
MRFMRKPLFQTDRAAPSPEAIAGADAAVAGPLSEKQHERSASDDIEAEIADHLASAAAELAGTGTSALAGERAARERFGNVAAVRRKCWWIQQGDQVMLRLLGIGLLAALVLAVAAFGIGGWKVQTAMADRLDRLTEELASLHRGQEAMLARQSAQPQPAQPPAVSAVVPEIRGQAYLGDPSHPAADAEIQIWNATRMTLFRRVRTDGSGRFRSRSIPAGDYFTLARLLGADGKVVDSTPLTTQPMLVALLGADGKVVDSTYPMPQVVHHLVQSQPLYAYSGDELPEISLDLRFHFGELSVEVVAPEPPEKTGTEHLDPWLAAIQYYPQISLTSAMRLPALPLDPNGDQLEATWPLFGGSSPKILHENYLRSPAGGTVERPLRNYPAIMAGEYAVSASVGGSFNEEPWRSLFPMIGMPPPHDLNNSVPITIAEGKRTHVRITVPKAIADEVLQLAIATDGEIHDADAYRKALAPRPAIIEVLTDQPLLPADYVFVPDEIERAASL